MLIRKQSFKVEKKQLLMSGIGGILLALSCMGLFLGFHYIDGGIAVTILFVCPVIICIIMYLFFHVKQSVSTLIGMFFAMGGVALLSLGKGVENFSLIGLVLVFFSAFAYAIYMVMVKVTCLKNMTSEALTYYVMLFGIFVFIIALQFGINLQKLPDLFSFGCAIGLALFPSLSSFLFMAIAIKYIGPSKTAILGILEPVTALVIGILVFGESLNWQQVIAVVIILTSVSLVITSKPPTVIKAKLKS
jgi:drug/metabolite transporter (DMT)-like permease